MSDEIVFDVLCTKVLDALRALGLGKFSIFLSSARLSYAFQFEPLVAREKRHIIFRNHIPCIIGTGIRLETKNNYTKCFFFPHYFPPVTIHLD